MKKVMVLSEGQTEQLFVQNVLNESFSSESIFFYSTMVRTSSSQKGGISSYKKIKNDLNNLLKGNWDIITTMIDLYRLPKDFPDLDKNKSIDPRSKVRNLEKSFEEDIDHTKFVPYLWLHEFEAVLFVEPSVTSAYLSSNDESVEKNTEMLAKIKSNFGDDPELINGKEQTSPSHRVREIFSSFHKTTHNIEVSQHLTIPRIASGCLHFKEWLEKLTL